MCVRACIFNQVEVKDLVPTFQKEGKKKVIENEGFESGPRASA